MDNLSKTFGKLTIPLLLLLAICFSALPAQAKYGGGTGEPNDPYLIYTAEQMNEIGLSVNWDDWDRHFKLMADIDLAGFTGTSFNIIGTWQPRHPFTGVFDGSGHTISNFTYTSTDRDNIGLFSYVGTREANAEIKDLGLINPNIDAGTGDKVGLLVGFIRVENVTITNCYVEGGSVAGNSSVGGLVGWNHEGTITNCYSTGNVGGNKKVGGLVGYNRGTITNSYSTGIVGGRQDIGGLVGGNAGTITVCYSTGSVRGKDHIGGLGGLNFGTITNCYSTDSLSGSSKTGGLVGWNYSGKITQCYSTGSVTASGNGIGGLVGDDTGMTMISACYSTANVKGNDVVGGLVGISSGYGSISDCYATGSVTGNDRVGGLIGFNFATVSACYSKGSVTGDYRVGGLVGQNWGAITNCYSTGSVSGNYRVGGLVGINSGTISNCYSTGSVSGNEKVGGLVGYNYHGTINDCYSAVSVSGDSSVGGLVGDNHGTITNCYSTGSVSGEYYVGGLVGRDIGEVTGSFWDIETSGQTTSAGGTGKTTAQMQTAATFFVWACGEPVWTIDEGNDYPRLWWENAPGEPITKPSYGGGGGTKSDPYLIYTAEQLNTIGLIGCHLDKHFKLMADIDLSGFTGTSFNIIGTESIPFTGVFDGNDHTISNFSYTSIGTGYIGLFGYIDDPNAEIKDVGLIDPNVDGGTGNHVGSLVSWLWDGTITNCYVEGGSVTGDRPVGGLVGCNNYGTITICYSTASVSGSGAMPQGREPFGVGGLVGYNSGTISNCFATGSVLGRSRIGGLVGSNSDNGTISNCHSTGSVSGDRLVGGLVGQNGETYCSGTTGDCWSFLGTISNCYSTGSVSGDRYVGGLVGYNPGGIITNCYSTGSVVGTNYVGGLVGYNDEQYGVVTASFWDIQTSGQTTSDGGTGKTTTEMQTQSTFTDAGWDFVGETFNGIDDIWFIPQQDYPHLWWEGMQVPMKLTPRTLNCRSKGNWVKAHLTLPEGFTFADVDSNRPAVLHSFGFESAPLYVSVNENELVEIEAAFEREAVCSLTGNWPEALTVAGFLTDGNIFLGTSTVRMITPGLKDIEELALYWLNADCDQPDFCNGIDMNRDSLVNLLDYALLLNSQVEFIRE